VFEMLVFGHAGVPVVLFPTSQARYNEYKDFRLIEAAAPLVDVRRLSRDERGAAPSRPGVARLLDAKDIPHWLDVWRWAKHDWPLWWDMFPRYLAKL